jgi:hypothetical protein
MSTTSSGFADYLLLNLRVAHLRARLMANELGAMGLALKGGLISADNALEHLADVGVMDLITGASS